MSYFSHSQVWAVIKNGKLYLGGRTNRAQVVFERETIEIIEHLQNLGQAHADGQLELPTGMN
jgi:cytochrome c biogenesis protein